jgi:signal transduction histidine kinase
LALLCCPFAEDYSILTIAEVIWQHVLKLMYLSARTTPSILIVLQFWFCAAIAAPHSPATPSSDVIEIQSVAVNGKSIPLTGKTRINTGPAPQNITFTFGQATNATRAPIRVRYKLEGYDNGWHEGGGEMFLMLRFYNDAGDAIGQKGFPVNGDSAGWSGDLKTSTFSHRRETVVVPPKAANFWIVMSSAGPPQTVGIYVVDHLVVSKLADSGPASVLLQAALDSTTPFDPTNQAPLGWTRDGIHPSMAKIIDLEPDLTAKALAIVDDDPESHAEWHTTREYAPAVKPGDRLDVEWNEVFTMGVGNGHEAHYEKLASGEYQFRVAEVTALGAPTGIEASIAIKVPVPLWEVPWFWAAVIAFFVAALMGVGRYAAWREMRREFARIESQRALEQERLRIAHDIHDDLGARLTQISLASAMAQDSPGVSSAARSEFDRISQMARDTVSALYETVWAVNPENDNLDALGNYLCQMVHQLCEQAKLSCRLRVPELPRDVQVASQLRHNVILAVKEAINNIIKHASATEVAFQVTFEGDVLTISIYDNGSGFDTANRVMGNGNGLANMKQRLAAIGGRCNIESSAGQGTTILMHVTAMLADFQGEKHSSREAGI